MGWDHTYSMLSEPMGWGHRKTFNTVTSLMKFQNDVSVDRPPQKGTLHLWERVKVQGCVRYNHIKKNHIKTQIYHAVRDLT